MFNQEKRQLRFVTKSNDGNASHYYGQHRIIVDAQTGVNYLELVNSNGCSITPLLDKNGKVVVDAVVEDAEQ